MDIKGRVIKDRGNVEVVDKLDKQKKTKLAARERSKFKVTGFLRRRKYDILLDQGIPPIEAARRVGVEIPRHKRIRPGELAKKIEEGV